MGELDGVSGTIERLNAAGVAALWRRGTAWPATRRRVVAKLVALVALVAVQSPAFADPDATHGAKLFRMFCAGCHKIADGNGGSDPDLNGVVGRAAGSMAGFQYSAAMRARAAAGLVWTPDNLNAWLTKPADFMPGTDMSFLYGFPRQSDRDDLIAYLEQYSPDYRPPPAAAQ